MRYFVSLICSFFVASCAFAGTSDSSVQPAIMHPRSNPAVRSREDKGRFAFGVKGSLLGVGAEIAARATHRSNVRAGFNVLGYSRAFNKDGINYNGHLSFRTIEAHYDIFPWARSFHVSPGMLAYVGNPVTASALVPGDQSFSLGGSTYYSDPHKPVRASGRLNIKRVSPMITAGFGNLVHRDSRRFTVPFEIGVAFQGSPRATLSLAGNVCESQGVNCGSVSGPTVQQNILSEQNKLDKSMRPFKVYPILSVGFGYKF